MYIKDILTLQPLVFYSVHGMNKQGFTRWAGYILGYAQ